MIGFIPVAGAAFQNVQFVVFDTKVIECSEQIIETQDFIERGPVVYVGKELNSIDIGDVNEPLVTAPTIYLPPPWASIRYLNCVRRRVRAWLRLNAVPCDAGDCRLASITLKIGLGPAAAVWSGNIWTRNKCMSHYWVMVRYPDNPLVLLIDPTIHQLRTEMDPQIPAPALGVFALLPSQYDFVHLYFSRNQMTQRV